MQIPIPATVVPLVVLGSRHGSASKGSRVEAVATKNNLVHLSGLGCITVAIREVKMEMTMSLVRRATILGWVLTTIIASMVSCTGSKS